MRPFGYSILTLTCAAMIAASQIWPASVRALTLEELRELFQEGYRGQFRNSVPLPSAVDRPLSVPTSLPPPIVTSGTPAFDTSIRASRIFSGPGQYPPSDFAAYGIVAFPSLAMPSDRDRHVMICEAYVATLPNASDIEIPRSEQMVTVWPVETNATGERLTLDPPKSLCDEAVSSYSQLMALRALRLAERLEPVITEGRGPYLLAWSPGNQHGTSEAHILRVDMSRVATHDQALEVFRQWVRDIEGNPELWQRGWSLERLRIVVRDWADDMGRILIP